MPVPSFISPTTPAPPVELVVFDLFLETGGMYRGFRIPIHEVCARRGIPVRELDIASGEDLARYYGVKGFPTMLLLRNGKEAGRTTNLLGPPPGFENWMDAVLAKPTSPPPV